MNTVEIVLVIWGLMSLSFALGWMFGGSNAQHRSHMDRSTPLS